MLFILINLIAVIRCVESTELRKLPNIVIILADDFGFDDVSFRGNQEFLTPNIDALAYHGKILQHHYAPPMCTPSRSALLTGRYPIHTGTQHFVISNEEPWALPTNITTMAEIFQRAGYSTNLIGKWHQGFARKEQTPTARGFDYHYGYWGAYIDYYKRTAKMPVASFNIGYDFRRNMDVECPNASTYMTDLLTTEAELLIRSNGNQTQKQPLFLLLSHLAVHTANEEDPLQAPTDDIHRFSYIKDPNRRKYAAMVRHLDLSVGRVIDALREAKQLENSIVIFLSDNGAPSVGQFANTGSNWPLRGQKNTPWEGGVRVAAAIWSPLMKHRGSIFAQPMYIGDWLPTLAHAAGITSSLADLHIDGIDLWPILVDHNETKIVREILHNLDEVWRFSAYMRGAFKYINGTTASGIYDSVLTYREEYDVDAQDRNYALEIQNSLASRALAQFDERPLTAERISKIRSEAAVRCGGALQRNCNPLLEECLYDISQDPCEQNNLARERSHAQILAGMRARVQEFRKSAWPIGNREGRMEFDPSRHDCLWTNFLEDAARAVPLQCDGQTNPCSRVRKEDPSISLSSDSIVHSI